MVPQHHPEDRPAHRVGGDRPRNSLLRVKQSCIRPPGRESREGGEREMGQPVADDDGDGDWSGIVDIAGPISIISFPVFASRNSHFVH